VTGGGSAAYWTRPALVGLTITFGAIAVYRLISVALSPFGRTWAFGNGDLVGYTDGARRFLETGSPYTPEQVAGPYLLGPQTFIHPPAALPLFLPFLVLPWVLWWLVPIALTVAAIVHLQPAAWTWPVMALLLCWPRSTGAILVGNSDIWVTAFVATGAIAGWPLALLIIKPIFAPLGLIGARRRSTWLGAAIVVGLSLLALPLWLQWVQVIQNADMPAAYSLLALPLPLVPVVAWLGRRAGRRAEAAPGRGLVGLPDVAP
jgi:hypothetical protein